MPQNRESGAAANKYGHEKAVEVAHFLDTQLLFEHSNEIDLNNERIVIKCARQKTIEIGVSLTMLERVQGIIAALEGRDGNYVLYRLNPQWYRTKMHPSRSNSPSAHKIMMVSCKVIREEAETIGQMP